MEIVKMTEDSALSTLAKEVRTVLCQQLDDKKNFQAFFECYVSTQLRMLNFVRFSAEEETPCNLP
jgi:hypothetical protein